jgi:hypothetical protein
LIKNAYSSISIINLQETKIQVSCTPDSNIEIDGFHMFRLDRDLDNFNEKGGGGLITYVNKEWAPNKPKVLSQISLPNAEILIILCRPLHLPSKYKCIININVYLRPQRKKTVTEKNNTTTASISYQKISFCIHYIDRRC